VTELEPEIRRAKMREEEAKLCEEEAILRLDDDRRRMKEEKEERRYKTSREDDVVSVAYTFQSLFDFDAELAQAEPQPSHYRHEIGTDSTTASPDDDTKAYERERRNARIYEIQRRIGKLLERRVRYIEEGRTDRIADLELNDIPDQVELLRKEGVAVSHERAWRWTHWCDACHFRIPSDHYHCTQCRDGNWDVCQECWDKGARCSGRGQHRITFNGRSIA
jgi:hypothetical protein